MRPLPSVVFQPMGFWTESFSLRSAVLHVPRQFQLRECTQKVNERFILDGKSFPRGRRNRRSNRMETLQRDKVVSRLRPNFSENKVFILKPWKSAFPTLFPRFFHAFPRIPTHSHVTLGHGSHPALARVPTQVVPPQNDVIMGRFTKHTQPTLARHRQRSSTKERFGQQRHE